MNDTKMIDKTSKKLAQLEALSAIVSSEQFNDFSETIRADSMWLLNDLVTSTRATFEELLARDKQK